MLRNHFIIEMSQLLSVWVRQVFLVLLDFVAAIVYESAVLLGVFLLVPLSSNNFLA